MKRIIVCFLLIGFITPFASVRAQEGNRVYEKGDIHLNAGLKLGIYRYGLAGNSLGLTLPLMVNAEFAAFNYVSCGGFFSYATSRYESSYGYYQNTNSSWPYNTQWVAKDFDYRYNLTEFGVRGTFHAIPFLNQTFPDAKHGLDGTSYDLYITVYSGLSFAGRSSGDLRGDDDAPDDLVDDYNETSFRSFFITPYIGGKYMFTNNFGAFAEIGGFRGYSPFEANLGVSLIF